MNHIREVLSYKYMIKSFVKREIRGKYQKSFLGILWSFLSPLFQIILYTLIFTFVFPSGIDYYYLFLMTGIIPWIFISEGVGQGATIVVANGDLVKKTYFPREVLCIASVIAKFVNMILAYIVVLIFLICSNVGISLRLIWLLPIVMLLQFVMVLGLALFFSAITVFLRDMEYIVSVILMFLNWATPIMYDVERMTEMVRKVIRLNPFTSIMCLYRDVLFYHNMPSMVDFIIPLISGVVFLFIGEMVFSKLSGGFAEEF